MRRVNVLEEDTAILCILNPFHAHLSDLYTDRCTMSIRNTEKDPKVEVVAKRTKKGKKTKKIKNIKKTKMNLKRNKKLSNLKNQVRREER